MDNKNATFCFVCQTKTTSIKTQINIKTNLPVCDTCKDSEAEKNAENEAIASLGEDFVCGCI